MTPEEHQEHHVRLHRAFDELLACYIEESRVGVGAGRSGSITNTILQLMEWSHQKTMIPTPTGVTTRGHDSRSVSDFEGQRQIIVLALAELALSRPGWEPEAIKPIVRYYDTDGLPLFEAFKKTSADRVKETHGGLA